MDGGGRPLLQAYGIKAYGPTYILGGDNWEAGLSPRSYAEDRVALDRVIPTELLHADRIDMELATPPA